MSVDIISHFYYDETSPSCMRWAVETKTGWFDSVIVTYKGKIAGGISSTTGYYQVSVKGHVRIVHRIIYEILYGPIPKGFQIDHINGDRSDNRKSNLRLVTPSENQRNRCLQSNSTTGLCGVVKETKITSGKSYDYFVALCYSGSRRNKKKYFSIKKLGYDTAFSMACQCREESILAANMSGANFTERHGK